MASSKRGMTVRFEEHWFRFVEIQAGKRGWKYNQYLVWLLEREAKRIKSSKSAKSRADGNP